MANNIGTCLGPTMGPTMGPTIMHRHKVAAMSKACTLPLPRNVQGTTLNSVSVVNRVAALGFTDCL